MDACANVEREVTKLLQKYGTMRSHIDRTLSDLIENLSSIRNELNVVKEISDELSKTHGDVLVECCKKSNTTMTRLANDHRDLHGSVSKIGRVIDKNFVSDYDGIVQPGFLQSPESKHILNMVISEHFLRHGMLDIAEIMAKEANLELGEADKQPFVEMHMIINCLLKKDLKPALEWVSRNREHLRAHNNRDKGRPLSTHDSPLEFMLHRQEFIALLTKGPEASTQMEALMYVRQLVKTGVIDMTELEQLMGCLLFAKTGLEKSPYRHLLCESAWDNICEQFTKDACSLLGLSVESPLSVCIRVGCKALPPLLNIRQVMEQRLKQTSWSARDELPIEISLGKEHQYHSIFACPILRQQSTPNNPPMRLACGHVISRDALQKLSNGQKVKCPYCPNLQNPEHAREIHL